MMLVNGLGPEQLRSQDDGWRGLGPEQLRSQDDGRSKIW
jgi:hypothetical protein